MNFREKLKNSRIFLDGATGTCLQKIGLSLGELPERWNLTRPTAIKELHEKYLEVGCDVVYTNTFGANCFKLGEDTEAVVAAGVRLAKEATENYSDRYVALDVGPTGKLLKPLGELDFEDAVNAFKRTIKAGVEAGADIVAIETMSDVYELKAAVLAAKETCDLPILATAVFGRDGKTMTGTSAEGVVALLEGLGVDVLGLNCSLDPTEMLTTVEEMAAVSSLPIAVKPNAGIPREEDGKAVFMSPTNFAEGMKKIAQAGARVLGGCCGTEPRHIKELIEACGDIPVKPIEDKNRTVVSSYSRVVTFGDNPVLIGERINPTGKKRLKEALRANDITYILKEAVEQEEKGAQVLDVNVGLPEIDEGEMLARCVCEIQAVTDLPLQPDTSDPIAMEKALRRYNGIPLINSVNGTSESMKAFLPLAKKYGGVLICLTLDEKGIPSDAADRIAIAERIIEEAARYGIGKNRLVFDTLATAVSADSTAANVSLEALEYIRKQLGCNTSLGISNISFGLPKRDFITSTYFALALSKGLSAAIYNPYSEETEKVYRAYMALTGRDSSCADYVDYATRTDDVVAPVLAVGEKGLSYCIAKGLKEEARVKTEELLKTKAPLEIVNGEIIPALDKVGKGFERKSVFLPQLLLSAEAASAAFEIVKGKMARSSAKKTKIIMATVKGDIHDIGKNIVCTVLGNYGFDVRDLGKDVSAERILKETVSFGADIVGLSALMTTTVVSMKETVELLKVNCPEVKICVGGAVLTEEYAESIGADRYCKDAMETVRYAEEIEGMKK